ncbi:MAG: hypothetical protein HYT03_01930 [Candidatus Harrisonbacteria bacterium]|nr:hypothetical protein [Candidatus Harrisonbacteria bacterium]
MAHALFLGFFFFFSLNTTWAASPALLLSPTSGSFIVGSTFDLSILLDTKGRVVSGLEVELFFPPDKLQLANPSVGRSLIQSWTTQPSFSNREGRIYLSGDTQNPGIRTSNGVVLTLNFRVIAPGSAQIEFGKKSRVFAGDGLPADILGQTVPAFLTLNPTPSIGPEIVSPTHPNLENWYRDSTVNFTWVKDSLADGFSYSLDHDPSGFPDSISETSETFASFSDLESGVWYFHLRQKVKEVWGGVSHFTIRIDKNPPSDFKVAVSPDKRTAERNLIVEFSAADSLSGLDHYEFKLVPLNLGSIEDPLFFNVDSPYFLSNLDIGRYHVIVRAFDRAGNRADQLVTITIVDPAYELVGADGLELMILLVLGGLALILLVMVLWIYKNHRAHIKHHIKNDIIKSARPFHGKKKKNHG